MECVDAILLRLSDGPEIGVEVAKGKGGEDVMRGDNGALSRGRLKIWPGQSGPVLKKSTTSSLCLRGGIPGYIIPASSTLQLCTATCRFKG